MNHLFQRNRQTGIFNGKPLHREDAKNAKKDKSRRENAAFCNKTSFSSFFSSIFFSFFFSSLRPSRLCGAKSQFVGADTL
jgi:hypothetical protein